MYLEYVWKNETEERLPVLTWLKTRMHQQLVCCFISNKSLFFFIKSWLSLSDISHYMQSLTMFLFVYPWYIFFHDNGIALSIFYMQIQRLAKVFVPFNSAMTYFWVNYLISRGWLTTRSNLWILFQCLVTLSLISRQKIKLNYWFILTYMKLAHMNVKKILQILLTNIFSLFSFCIVSIKIVNGILVVILFWFISFTYNLCLRDGEHWINALRFFKSEW